MRAMLAVAVMLLAPALALAQTERATTFQGAGGASLAATLTLPAGTAGQRVPAVLLIQGSGPTDRDGNQGPANATDLLKHFAQALAARGIASLRFDKRGMHANSAQSPPPERAAQFFHWDNFAGDALAGYRHLTGMAEIEGTRVAVLGHSEGGILALTLARAAADARPAALVLAATPGRPFDVLLIEQVDAIMMRQGASAASRALLNAEHRRIVEHIREQGTVPPRMHPGLAPLYPAYLGPFFQASFRADPAMLAAAYDGPVLVLQGEYDAQVSAERDAKALMAALAGRAGGEHKLAVFPRLSHSFKPSPSPDESRFDGPVPAEVTAALLDWLVPRLTGSR